MYIRPQNISKPIAKHLNKGGATRRSTKRKRFTGDDNTGNDDVRAKTLIKSISSPSIDYPNLYVSMHSCAIDPVKPRGLDLPTETEIDQVVLNTYTAVVPNNLIVVLFTPTDMVAMTTEYSEQMDRQLLRNMDWLTINDELSRNAKIYFPGDRLYNQNMSFDSQDEYFDIFKIPHADITDEDMKKAVASEGDAIYNLTYRELNHPRQLNQPYNLRITQDRVDRHNPYKSINTRMLLHVISSNTPDISRRQNKPRIVYIMSCNPAIDLDDVEYVWENVSDQKRMLRAFNDLRSMYQSNGRRQFRRLQKIILGNRSMQTRNQKSRRRATRRDRWEYGAPTFERTESDIDRGNEITKLLAQKSEDRGGGSKLSKKAHRCKRTKRRYRTKRRRMRRPKRKQITRKRTI